MANQIGGLRDRLIKESLYQNLKAALTTLQWFAAGREHTPVVMMDAYPDENDEVQPNTLAFSMGDGGGPDTELGNSAEDHEIVFFCDFFAENDSVGEHLRGDIYEYFRTNKQQVIYDYSTDSLQFATVEIQEDIDKRKPERAVTKWQKHWYVVSFTVIDYARPHS